MRGLFLCFTVITFHVSAQVTVDEFLQSVWDDPELKSMNAQNKFLESKPYRLAPVQKMEFRTESNQLDPSRQEFSLRVNPSNPWEMKYTIRYYETYQEMLLLDQSRTLKKSLQVRYQLVVDWLYYQELMSLREEDKKNTETQLRILEGQRASSYFKAEDYLDLRLELIEKVIELESTHFEIDNQRRMVDTYYEAARFKNLLWAEHAVISVNKIENVVDSLWHLDSGSGEVAYRQKKVELASDAFRLEKSNINVGFLQARYQEYRLEQDRRPWSLSMGVTIPIFNPNKGDMTRRQLDALGAQADLEKAKSDHQNGRMIMREKVKNMVKRYHEIDALADSMKISGLLSTVQVMKNNNPAITVRAQSNLIKMKVMKARLRREIFIAYLEFLDYSEAIQQHPLINYLSPHLNPISP